MNKIRYWKKQGFLANLIYQSTSNETLMKRAYNTAIEIDDYLFNLEE